EFLPNVLLDLRVFAGRARRGAGLHPAGRFAIGRSRPGRELSRLRLAATIPSISEKHRYGGPVKKLVLQLTLSVAGLCAQTHPLQEIIEAARTNSPSFRDLLTKMAPNVKTQGA